MPHGTSCVLVVGAVELSVRRHGRIPNFTTSFGIGPSLAPTIDHAILRAFCAEPGDMSFPTTIKAGPYLPTYHLVEFPFDMALFLAVETNCPVALSHLNVK